MNVGERFIPYKMFNGIHVPNCLLEIKTISSNSKLCWGRLSQYAGDNGFCYPKQETLAKELGISLSSVKRSIDELVKNKYIEIVKPSGHEKLMHLNIKYYFLWHESLHPKRAVPTSQVDRSGTSQVDRSNIKESYIKESFKKFSKENLEEAEASYSISSIKLNRRKPLLRKIIKETIIYPEKKTKSLPVVSDKVLHILSYYDGKGLKVANQDKAPKGHKNSIIALNKLLQGKTFNGTEYPHYANHKFTSSEIRKSIDQFALVALNPDYEPRNLEYKKSLSKKLISDFIYSPFITSENGFGKSLFIHFLENPAKLLKEKDVNVENLYPKLTERFKEKYVKEVLGVSSHKFSSKEENEFRKASNYWKQFFIDNSSHLWGEFANPTPTLIADTIIETFRKNNNDNLSNVQPWMFNRGLICNQVPAYLKHQGVIVEDGSIYPQQSRRNSDKSYEGDFSISLYDDV